jgi:hypothetical protein
MYTGGITEESFVRNALEVATFDDGRWIANQGSFNFHESEDLSPAVKAAIVTSANVYSTRHWIPEVEVANALNIKTIGDARKFIGRVWTSELQKEIEKWRGKNG